MTTNEQKNEWSTISVEQQRHIDKICTDIEKAYGSDQALQIEDLISLMPENLVHSALVNLIKVEIGLRGVDPNAVASEYRDRFPNHPSAVAEALREEELGDDTPIPERIDRFEIIKVLGEGAFGRVYLARDSDMDREVALKVPSASLFQSGAAVQAFLQEARSAAKVKHPGLVAVYDVQRQADQPFIVQEYVQGTNLADWLQQHKLNMQKIVQLVAEIAEALVEAHRNDLVHRDLKPANILIDEQGHVHVADFGLALHVSWQHQRRGEIAGSPAYMSPEQTRGETHRIDGRTDIWSLGVILYEMLVGQRPFAGKTRTELWDAIQYTEVRPPSMRNPNVPHELDRICLVCLSKQQSDRYKSATHLLGDLDDWLAKNNEISSFTQGDSHSNFPSESAQGDTDRISGTSRPAPRIIPRGLRSFEKTDADFYLSLLPGVPDKSGLPPSVSFWTSRIDETDEDLTFSVGVMYGPSGCGKSSLVKAGILPRLGNHVDAIYIESTPQDTESRLLKELTKKVPLLGYRTTDLVEAIRSVRDETERGVKVLIVLDQFEQWLYDHGDDASQHLIHALRHCDGGKVQCLALIRDDFWMPVTRFMRQLDVRLLEDETVKSVDLFSVRHAKKVLTKFGQAYGSVPEQLEEENRNFVTKSIAGLAKDGKVICVQLALFAQMMQERPWTPKSLESVGGARGVGVAFLEETFSSSTASKRHRRHQDAARRVLESLLPETGTDIKGAMRSHAELILTSNYENRPDDFHELVQILDSELRLITPTDPDDGARPQKTELNESDKYFQLTHDYLVPALREWLHQKRQETRHGRAELRLKELASLWKDKPEKRHLPSLTEFFTIQLLTKRKSWTDSQRQMMQKSRMLHLTRMTAAAIFLIVVGWIAYESNGHIQSNKHIATLKSAHPENLLETVTKLKKYRRWAHSKLNDLLRNLEGQSELTSDKQKHQLHARIALVESDNSHYAVLKEELLTQEPAYLACLRDVLAPYKSSLIGEMREVLQNREVDRGRRFRAGFALATYAPDEPWDDKDLALMSRELIDSNIDHQLLLRGHLKPIAKRLLPHIESAFGNENFSETQLVAAAAAMADFASNDTELLSRFLCAATPKQFEVLVPAFSKLDDPQKLTLLKTRAANQPGDGLEQDERLQFGRSRAGASFALLRSGQHAVALAALRVVDDPESITQFVHRCRAFKVTSEDLLSCLKLANEIRQSKQGTDRKIEDRVLYALILALGEFQLNEITESERTNTVEKLKAWFRDDPSSGIHGATRWLLCHWGKNDEVKQIEECEVPFSAKREWFTLKIKNPSDNAQDFYMTFVVMPAGEYEIGSPEGELHRAQNELRHKVTIEHDFAILDRELTFAELGAYKSQYIGAMRRYSYSPEHPAMATTWYESVRFCRWLTKSIGWNEASQCYPDEDQAKKDGYPADVNSGGAPMNWPVDLAKGGFRLPTETEWEVACRGGMMHGVHSFGNDSNLLNQYGWFFDNSNERIHLGRELRPNLRGFFDLHGNVSEWCHDWYGDDSYEKSEPNPIGPEKGMLRIFRSGGYIHPVKYCRASGRDSDRPSAYFRSLGFRPAFVPSIELSDDAID